MKLVVIEDDTEIAEFISLAFEVGWSGIKVFNCHHGIRGIEIIEKESPDVVILDLGLPDIDGLEVLKQVRSFSSVPIIIVTVRGTETDIIKGLQQGADEYLVKPFGQLELLARVKAVLRRYHNQGIDVDITCGPLHFDPSTNLLEYGSSSVHLTRTEGLILQELMRNPNYVVTHTQLADVIWGDFYPNAPEALR
ncbi:response regulator transcription factor, partial [Chloroflexota bacterium]